MRLLSVLLPRVLIPLLATTVYGQPLDDSARASYTFPRAIRPDIGSPVSVRGRITAAMKEPDGRISDIVVSDGVNSYHIARQEVRDELYKNLGKDIVIEGRIAARVGALTVVEPTRHSISR